MVYSSTQGIAVRTLGWNLSTTEVFSHFSDKPWAMLLDSASADHIDARFDIIVFDPIATLVTQGQITKMCHHKQDASTTEISTLDPFFLLNQAIEQYCPTAYPCELPFSGGALGSFSYDLGRVIESLPTTAKKDIALPEMNVGIYLWALIFDSQNATWSMVHYLGQQQLENQLTQIEKVFATPAHKERFSLTTDWQAQIDKQAYSDKFAVIQAYLHSGDCYQINLTQRFEAQYQGDEWLAYLKLRQTNKAPFSAFCRLPHNVLLSISPERFIQLKGDAIQTKPIKGTMPRSTDPQLDRQSAELLANSEKDRAENLMIVDLLRNDIGKVAQPGSVRVPALFAIESFPAVHHLVSTVTAKLDKGYHATDLLRAAFPGGSITGAPKIRAMEIIEELEPSRRSLYCGSIGYISQDGQMDSSITIRTLVAENNKLYCWAGGGIVADSLVDAEYQESYDKVSKILPILANSNDTR
ncbi:aminodeoxychorismate synthase component I [Shewanella psychrotolerans]|uniref:aminodeoxychorismate synthase component I n=1 Tax=Shewanella psychrotolerans TaxID=2864206 RepID=UPI001C65923E|nr:aminodeoxychorismate synthase component I [Shewanella psychrotolerans]QYJ99838.1 aminodeoxychorismate synthase component I [Shewanella psychrotolerans]